jgi:hypothetical protein
LKSINSDFELDDQTIFLYEELDYKIKILTTNINYINMDNKNYIYSINNVKNVFEYIFNNYNSLPENIYIQLNSNIIPFDFFYNQQIPTFLDRMFDIQTMTIQKRVYNYKSLLDLDMACPDSKDDYFDKSMSQSVENLLPSRDNIVIIWTKLIMNDIPAPVYYNSSGIYLVSRDNILAKPHSYYQKIVGLLEKKSDQKIFNLFQFALYSIFFS